MLANLAAACMVLLSAYAQWSIPSHTAGPSRALFARLLLAAAGTAVGLFAVRLAEYIDVQGASAVALFLIGFGQVHVPVSLILFLKSQRGDAAVLTRH